MDAKARAVAAGIVLDSRIFCDTIAATSVLQLDRGMPPPTTRPQIEFTGELSPLSITEVLGMVLVSYLVFLVFLSFVGGSYWSLVGGKFGDNPDYLQAASAIDTGSFPESM